MAKWVDYDVDERSALIANVSSAKNIDPAAAEKDWWVTAVLYAVFHSSIADYALLKGGTSLSKGWDIISRFSEDVDIALDKSYYLNVKKWSCAECTSNTQIHNLREKSQNFLFGKYKNELAWMLQEMGLGMVQVLDENEMRLEQELTGNVDHDKDPSVLYVRYPSIFSKQKSYALPVVKIEISCLSMAEPYEIKRMFSLVEQINAVKFGDGVDDDFNQDIKTVSPARTFLEKAFLLAEEFMKDSPKVSRMSRHLYDIEKLSHTEYMAKALADRNLYMQIVRHRKRFYHPGYVDYAKILPEVIDFIPPADVIDSFRSDYNEMRGSFIYEDNPLGFDELLERVTAINESFRK
jgi:hypothetical protein